jgi:hypothetical protein
MHKEMTMKHKRMANVLLAGCAAILLSPGPVGATQAAPAHEHPAAQAKAQPAMADKCKAMMAEHDKMMADMKAADQRLDSLVVKMNAESGQAKADATAAVVNEVVAQRKTMRDGMMKMQQDMMGHMMEHMQAGPDSMAMCPMMKMNMMKMGGMKH